MNQNTAPVIRDPKSQESRRSEDEIDSAMATVIADVARDATSAPGQYLRDTIVPEGGE